MVNGLASLVAWRPLPQDVIGDGFQVHHVHPGCMPSADGLFAHVEKLGAGGEVDLMFPWSRHRLGTASIPVLNVKSLGTHRLTKAANHPFLPTFRRRWWRLLQAAQFGNLAVEPSGFRFHDLMGVFLWMLSRSSQIRRSRIL